ncbi:MAG: 2OG-Fe(II) oxygenase [Pedobacter sp.]|nr:MAG: 2OG-Fe(II) oxygenase [Pedobacter sp.]
MENSFDTLINTFISDQVGISEDFLTKSLSLNLQKHLLSLHDANLMSLAGTGNAMVALQNSAIRGDKIHWLDRKHDNEHENAFFDVIDAFILHLNNTCYTGINDYEFHYTIYEAGRFYKKHVDQFNNNTNRKYSMIIYLNEDWILADGGQLRIHHQQNTQDISPLSRKGVFFNSNTTEHEVMVTNKSRMSITGWLKANHSS